MMHYRSAHRLWKEARLLRMGVEQMPGDKPQLADEIKESERGERKSAEKGRKNGPEQSERKEQDPGNEAKVRQQELIDQAEKAIASLRTQTEATATKARDMSKKLNNEAASNTADDAAEVTKDLLPGGVLAPEVGSTWRQDPNRTAAEPPRPGAGRSASEEVSRVKAQDDAKDANATQTVQESLRTQGNS